MTETGPQILRYISSPLPGYRFHIRPGGGGDSPQGEVPQRGEGVHQHGPQQGRCDQSGGVRRLL